MPTLRLFHRKTIFAGDDLQPTSYLTIILRLIQLFGCLLPALIYAVLEARWFLRMVVAVPKDTTTSTTTTTIGDDWYHGVDAADDHVDDGEESNDVGGYWELWMAYLFGDDPDEDENDDYGGRRVYPIGCDADNNDDSSSSLFSTTYDAITDEPSTTNTTNITRSIAHYYPLCIAFYLLLSTIHCLISILIERCIASRSSIGTPTNPTRREKLLIPLIERKWIWSSIVANVLLVVLVGISVWGGAGAGAGMGYRRAYLRCRTYQISRISGTVAINRVEPVGWWVVVGLLWVSQAWEVLFATVALGSLLRKPKILQERHSETMGLGLVTSLLPNRGVGSCDSRGGGGGGGEGGIPLGNRWNLMDVALEGQYPTSPFPHHHHHHNHHHGHHHQYRHQKRLAAQQLWDRRCRSFCQTLALCTCFLFGGRELLDPMVGDYGDVSRALADYFEDFEAEEGEDAIDGGGGENWSEYEDTDRGDAPSSTGRGLDLSVSDVAVGLMALRRIQRMKVLEGRKMRRKEQRKKERRKRRKWKRQGTVMTDGTGLSYVPATEGYLLESSSLSSSSSSCSLSSMSFVTAAIATTPPCASTTTAGSNPRTPPATRPKIALSPEKTFDRTVLAEGARFARHALSIYTWVLYVYSYPSSGLARLLCDRVSDLCHRGGGDSENAGACSGGGEVTGGGSLSPDPNERSPFGAVHRNGVGAESIEGRVRGDNPWRLHTKALLRHSGLNETDLVYANFENRYGRMPYCIMLDHGWSSVVVAIRGTLSLEDCVVDVLLDAQPLDDLGREYSFDGEGQYCHNGILGVVRNILNDLERHQILKALLLGPNALYPSYTLRITGHSLGGGAATLLGFCLRNNYPSLRVIAISPPGGFITWRLATECKDFVFSFVLDSDLVPRLSVDKMERLRDEVLDLVGRIKVPKAVVTKTFLENGVCFCCKGDSVSEVVDGDFIEGGEGDDDVDDEGDGDDGIEEDDMDYADEADDDLEFLTDENAKMLYTPEEAASINTPFSRQLRKMKQAQAERRNRQSALGDSCSSFPQNIRLFPPGFMVHLIKTGERRGGSCRRSAIKCLSCGTTNAGYEYTPVWADNSDFDEIVVSPTMGTDHFPNRVCAELERAAEAFGLELGVGFDTEESKRAQRGGVEERR